tara:strand:+ start:1504 stop:2775 length:1272 start_codon:yes stop_codon:yes gene_type:complete
MKGAYVHLSTVSEWLDWIGSVHQTEIELGLERIRKVAMCLGLLESNCVVITVGGTNGKGSVVAGLEAIYLAAGYHVGVFTSPFILTHNEQVRVDGTQANDESFCDAFAKIESARSEVTLTPFEYHALAALMIFKNHPLDVMVLEVGLGGRLDAVNVLDADVSVVTSISIDHVAWLGDTREKIAIEKAGIFRAGRPAICGEIDPPVTLVQTADTVGAPFYQSGKHFHHTKNAESWTWHSQEVTYVQLPYNNLLIQNMATCLMAITSLQHKLPVTDNEVRQGLATVSLPGRMQIVKGPVMEMLDVAHNPGAATVLAEKLSQLPCTGKTVAVFSMLDDKDIDSTIAIMQPIITEWMIAPLESSRGASLETLKKIFRKAVVNGVHEHQTIANAYQAALQQTNPGDRIIIFGSFYTVAEIMRLKQPAP